MRGCLRRQPSNPADAKTCAADLNVSSYWYDKMKESDGHQNSKSVRDLSRAHHAAVVEAIMEFQFFEERLKCYLYDAYKLIKLRINGCLTFNYSEKEIDNASLGKLIFLYKKVSSNEKLFNKMEMLAADRNYVSHKGFVVQCKVHSETEKYEDEIEKIKGITKRLRSCVMPIWSEAKNISAAVGCEIDGDDIFEQKRKINDIESEIIKAKEIISSDCKEEIMQNKLDKILRSIRGLSTECEFDPSRYGEGPCGM